MIHALLRPGGPGRQLARHDHPTLAARAARIRVVSSIAEVAPGEVDAADLGTADDPTLPAAHASVLPAGAPVCGWRLPRGLVSSTPWESDRTVLPGGLWRTGVGTGPG